MFGSKHIKALQDHSMNMSQRWDRMDARQVRLDERVNDLAEQQRLLLKTLLEAGVLEVRGDAVVPAKSKAKSKKSKRAKKGTR